MSRPIWPPPHDARAIAELAAAIRASSNGRLNVQQSTDAARDLLRRLPG